ncbi:unnamed protein product [Cylicocyclus nassatus]|uniref:Amino acid transporter transmembrane domain-containing protein n=1 Tax=Cylicocyclus nassatus TaxID=53992 RepID=A0AA36HD17_CYLNA|nr:unnamed protein product [Cylicocyclus nassatus]
MIRSSYAFINLLKATVGVGVFAMPMALKQAGFWTGLILSVGIGIINAHGMMKIVSCSQYLCKRKQMSNIRANRNGATIRPVCLDAQYIKAVTDEEQSHTSEETISKEGADEERSRVYTIETESEKVMVEGTVEKRFTLDYGGMAAEAFTSTRSRTLRMFGKPSMIFVNACIIGLQLGICSAFYIFVVDHAKEALDYMLTKDLSRNMLFFTALPFFILIANVSNMTLLSWIGLLGNVLLAISTVIIYVHLIMKDNHLPISKLPVFTNVEGASLAAGCIIYSYTGQGVLLGLESKMQKPKKMLGFFGVISTAMGTVTLLNTVTGLLGYITYGEDLEGSITLNLSNEPLHFSVKIMLLVMTYLSYPVVMYPIVDMFFPFIERRIRHTKRHVVTLSHYVFRYVVVLISFALAYVIPNFKDILPLIGTLTGTILAIFFPPLLHMVVFLKKWKKGNTVKLVWNMTHNVIYLVLSIVLLVVDAECRVCEQRDYGELKAHLFDYHWNHELLPSNLSQKDCQKAYASQLYMASFTAQKCSVDDV